MCLQNKLIPSMSLRFTLSFLLIEISCRILLILVRIKFLINDLRCADYHLCFRLLVYWRMTRLVQWLGLVLILPPVESMLHVLHVLIVIFTRILTLNNILFRHFHHISFIRRNLSIETFWWSLNVCILLIRVPRHFSLCKWALKIAPLSWAPLLITPFLSL